MTIWLVASGYLVSTGFYDREVANTVRQVSIPAVSALASIQRERGASVAYLAESAKDLQELLERRQDTDRRVSALREVADSALSGAPESITTRWKKLADYLDQLPEIRSVVDSRLAERQRVCDFYNQLFDAAADLFDHQARVVPDVAATQGAIAGTTVFRASDQMSRSGSIIAGAFGARTLSREDYLQFVSLAGAYHSELAHVAPVLRPTVRKMYEDLVAGDSWKSLVAAENALIATGGWNSGIPRGLPVTGASWEILVTQISEQLIKLTIAQADEVSAQALRTGNTQLLIASLGSLVALLIAVMAILWAIRQSRILVDQALSVRLAQLGKDASTVVDQRLPDMMERLRRRERVDLAVELPRQDYGSDEIGQVADVLNRSLQAAVGAAVDEATIRAAGTTMLMGVARRPQRPLQHGLQVIEDLQNRIGDEKLLAELFDINHQLTQTRRFLENLVILSGGQTGRRFHKPVLIRRILLAAIAETQQYKRIAIRSTPEAALAGAAVAGTAHLLAELLDNALTFSPPESEVWISCSRVKRGIVVEIEDAGVGMVREDLDRANERLATAPTPDVTALKDGSQVGLWVVAELAKRSGIQVTLRTSAYGGLLAIVLLPDRLVAGDPETLSTDLEDMASGGVPAPAAPAVADHRGRVDLAGVSQLMHKSQAASERTDRAGGPASGRQPDVKTVRHGGPTDSRSETRGVRPLRQRRATLPPLPERRPQAHLAPELRGGTANDPDSRSTAAEPVRSPEEARARFTRYQQGWRAGREAGIDGIPTTGNDETGKRDGRDAAE
ncbi:MAG: sensor histidine kinase [Micromonosporaceae bacterium]|nr:sensor histidine kinase [Micromonosporaceae bacterium]